MIQPFKGSPHPQRRRVFQQALDLLHEHHRFLAVRDPTPHAAFRFSALWTNWPR